MVPQDPIPSYYVYVHTHIICTAAEKTQKDTNIRSG
jgi:hypothetical protein